MPKSIRFFFIVTFCLLLVFAFGQNTKEKDRLIHQSIDVLLDSVYLAHRNVDYTNSYELAQKSLKLSKEANYQEGMLKSYIYLAQNYSSVGKYNESQIALNEAQNINKKRKNNFIQFEIQRIKGRNYGDMRLFQKSIQEFKKNLELVDHINKNQEEKDYLRCMTYENLYVTYDNLNKLDSSFYYMDLSKKTLDKISPQLAYISKSTLNTYLGRFFTKRDMADSAIYYFENASLINKKYNYPYNSFNDESWGDLLLSQKKSKEALEKYLSAIKGYEEFNSYGFLSKLYHRVSDIYLELGEIEESKRYKNKAFDLKEELHEEKMKALGAELTVIESENDKNDVIFRWVQYSLLFGLLCIIGLIGFIFFKRKMKYKSVERVENIQNKRNFSSDFEEVVQYAKENNPEFLAKFEDVYPEFIKSLLKIQPNLQNSELTFCGYVYLNFTTKEIANYTSTSPRTVQTRKYNIRKKLNIPTEEDIYVWLRKIDC